MAPLFRDSSVNARTTAVPPLPMFLSIPRSVLSPACFPDLVRLFVRPVIRAFTSGLLLRTILGGLFCHGLTFPYLNPLELVYFPASSSPPSHFFPHFAAALAPPLTKVRFSIPFEPTRLGCLHFARKTCRRRPPFPQHSPLREAFSWSACARSSFPPNRFAMKGLPDQTVAKKTKTFAYPDFFFLLYVVSHAHGLVRYSFFDKLICLWSSVCPFRVKGSPTVLFPPLSLFFLFLTEPPLFPFVFLIPVSAYAPEKTFVFFLSSASFFFFSIPNLYTDANIVRPVISNTPLRFLSLDSIFFLFSVIRPAIFLHVFSDFVCGI